MLTTIEEIWNTAGNPKEFRVRFRDWDIKIKYFVIEGYSQDEQRLVGKLDNGEVISYAKDNKGWQVYYRGQENSARAI
ncbi:hypothetical protein N9B72_01750 [Bacteriovoracaceae bacterium]|nr:hypothetical protein [Bacteriovoracaceae bacterium]